MHALLGNLGPATAYHPPTLEFLRRYNVNRPGPGLGELGQIRNGGFRERLFGRRFAARRAAAALTPEQRVAQDNVARFKAELWRGKSGTPNFAVTPLSIEGKQLQAATLARDWDALFGLTGGVNNWVPRAGQHAPSLGKYSFVIENGRRRYIPFTEAEIASFVFSRHYRIQPGWTCSDEQKQLGVNAHWEKTQRHIAKYRNASNPLHIWPILPGWGYPGQTYMCQKEKKSLWVKIRKKVYIAVAIVAAVYLGPVVVSKLGAAGAEATAAGEAAGGIVGAGAKAGAITVKVGKAAETASLFSKIKTGTSTLLGYVNKARTIDAIVHGELPPPPIGIAGSSFREWALIVAKEKIVEEAKEKAAELGTAYIQKKMTEREEAKLRAEIAEMQRQLEAITPADTPMEPAPELAPEIQQVMVKEKVKSEETNNFFSIAVPLGIGAMLLAG